MPNNTDVEDKRLLKKNLKITMRSTGQGKQLDLSDTDLTNIDFGYKALFLNANLGKCQTNKLKFKN